MATSDFSQVHLWLIKVYPRILSGQVPGRTPPAFGDGWDLRSGISWLIIQGDFCKKLASAEVSKRCIERVKLFFLITSLLFVAAADGQNASQSTNNPPVNHPTLEGKV